MFYYLFSVITRKISKKGRFGQKKTSSLPPLWSTVGCWGGKESVHTVYRQSGGHCAKIGRPKGGFERAYFVLCGMKVLGCLVESEGSICLFCPPLRPFFWSFCNDEQVLQENNSWNSCSHCANFCRCFCNIYLLLFMSFLLVVCGRKVFFFWFEVKGSHSCLCASLVSARNNFAHRWPDCANIW
jgi:hypothetical protein